MPVEYPGFVLDAAINSHEPETPGIGADGIDDLPEQLIRAIANAINGKRTTKPRFMNETPLVSNSGRTGNNVPPWILTLLTAHLGFNKSASRKLSHRPCRL